MKIKRSLIVLFGIVFVIAACATSKIDLTPEAAQSHYENGRTAMIAGYQKGGNPIALEYPAWKSAVTAPAIPGVHGKRYLVTYVNDTGYDTYVEFASQNVEMPVGTIIAKESFNIRGQSDFEAGPLFIMEKVGSEKAPTAGGWFYSGVEASGKPMKVKQNFCHSCHKAFSTQDSLGYPAVNVRVGYVSPEAGQSQAMVGSGDAARGKEVFESCTSCHQIGAKAKNDVGPVLTNVIGRPAASFPGYTYSDDLYGAKKKGLVWDEQHLFEWLKGPSEFLQAYLGTNDASSKMPIDFEDPQEHNDVIVYLRSLSSNTETVENP
jgi:cytochrome c2